MPLCRRTQDRSFLCRTLLLPTTPRKTALFVCLAVAFFPLFLVMFRKITVTVHEQRVKTTQGYIVEPDFIVVLVDTVQRNDSPLMVNVVQV